MNEEMAKKVAALVRGGGVAIFSGAGLSTESGLKDFRSKDGIWANVDPARLASVDALENNYDEFLEFYKTRLFGPNEVQPNVGHKLVAEWEKRGFVDGVITQNVDRLHQKAGAEKVWELHGNHDPIYCHDCGKVDDRDNFLAGNRCSLCGGRLRPSVVLFGEMLPQEALNAADKLCGRCRTLIVLGSSLVVSPANYFPRQAKINGANLVIINRDSTPLDGMADIVVHEEIGPFLTEVEKFI